VRIQDKLDQALMLREERVCTQTLVNIMIPLGFISLMSLLSPYFLMIVPIDHQDVCWFYVLSRDATKWAWIEDWLYYLAYTIKVIINIAECIGLIIFFYKIK
jgi:hypothetical protein